MSNLLQGIPGQFRTDVPGTDDIRFLRTSYVAFYVDDGIQLRTSLRMNVGLRYAEDLRLERMLERISDPGTYQKRSL